jgi:maltose alpha-D-glucosyltransferase/alpha-amylase
MEHAIRTRKECPEFGWGNLCFLETDTPAVLAHACTWHGQTMVAIHNLSHLACSIRVNWPTGTRTLEPLLGGKTREPLTYPPSRLDLDGYDYCWLRVRGCDGAPA